MNILQLSKHTAIFASNLKTARERRNKWKKALNKCWHEEGKWLDTPQFIEFIHTKYGINLILKYVYGTPTIDNIEIDDYKKALIFQIKYPV